jgi:general secretion pathway protein D
MRALAALVLCGAALGAAERESLAQRLHPRPQTVLPPSPPTGAQGQPGAAASAAPPAAPAAPAPAATATAPDGGAPAPGAKSATGPGGKTIGDTQGLTQFETGVEYAPRSPGEKVAFSLEDADLSELVRVIGELTGKRFIFGGKVHNIKATVFSPQKVTVAEAYQAFLSILEANGLTVVPHGRFYKIVDSPDAKMGAPVYVAGEGATGEDRFITRIHRLRNGSAEEIAGVLGHFKSKDGDITVFGPGNLLIITDTGTNIQRMMRILEDVDVGGVGDQIWIEPIHYGIASDIASRLNEVFELKGGAQGKEKASPTAGDVHITKILPDDRSNSVVIIGTERAYLRVLEFIKRLDIPRTGEGEIHVVLLQHADAVELAKTLNEIVTGAVAASGGAPKPGTTPLTIFESGVKVSADKATNSIVVTSSLRDFANLRTVIDQLDQPRRQVFIEAAIMDLNIDRENQVGMAFHAGATPQIGPASGGESLLYGGLNPFRSLLLPSPTDSTLNAFALGVRGPALPGSENLLGTGISIPAFGVLINALSSTNDSDVLTTPHILATDNVPAEINVGQNIPLQTNFGGFGGGIPGLGGTTAGAANPLATLGAIGGGFGTAPRQDIGTKVKIVPHLNDSDEVRLEVTEEISDTTGLQPIGSLGAVPFSKRTAQTQLVVKDQQTVIIGGLVRSRVQKTSTKIPLLGDIPVLGALFRSTSSSLVKANLILVLTPYIIREQSDLRAVFERKMQERQEFLDHYFVFGDQNQYEPPKDYSRTSGLLEYIRQSYMDTEEQRRLEELTRPRELKTHEPGQPLELPAPVGGAETAPAPAAPAAPAAPPAAAPAPANQANPPGGQPPVNVAPPPRSVEKLEK